MMMSFGRMVWCLPLLFPAMVFGQTSPATQAAAVPTTQPIVTATTQPAVAGKVVVTVNGQPITDVELEETFAAVLMQETRGRQLPPEMLAQARGQMMPTILEMMIDDRLFDEAVARAGISVTDAELVAEMQKRMEGFFVRSGVSREEFADQVSTHSGMPLDAFVAERAKDTGFRQAVLQAKLLQKRSGEALTVTPEEIKARYERDLAEVYTHPEMVRASHILIATDQLKTDAERATARAEAEAILVDVKKPGADFAAVASARSSCPSRTQGGDLGFFPRKDAMVEPFAVVAFGLKEGEISQVVETQFGYHIIKATGRKPESVATLAEASSTIRDELEAEKMSAARKTYVATLRETAKIVHVEPVEPMAK